MTKWEKNRHFAGIIPTGAFHQGGHNVAAQTLAIAHYGVHRLLTQVMDEVHSKKDAAQLLKKGVHSGKKLLTLVGVGDDRVNHLMVAVHHTVKLIAVALVAA